MTIQRQVDGQPRGKNPTFCRFAEGADRSGSAGVEITSTAVHPLLPLSAVADGGEVRLATIPPDRNAGGALNSRLEWKNLTSDNWIAVATHSHPDQSPTFRQLFQVVPHQLIDTGSQPVGRTSCLLEDLIIDGKSVNQVGQLAADWESTLLVTCTNDVRPFVIGCRVPL